MPKENSEKMLSNPESLNRPAWTSDDWHAYKHKHTRLAKGQIKATKKLLYYYEKSDGTI